MKTNIPLVFYNFYHNGDLFQSKPFVKEIVNNIPVPVYYAHGNHPKVLIDLKLNQIRLQQGMPINSDKVIITENLCLVNTWIGAYFKSGVPGHREGSCTLGFTYGMYEYIYEQLNEIYGCNLKLNPNKIDYFSTIDFNKFDLSTVDKYLSNDKKRKVLVCNGPALSNQSLKYNGNMQNIIINLASSYKDITFICTENSFNSSLQNIVFTDEITKRIDCDLNEISYISTFCDVIIGRFSGPYCFSCTKENILNFNKTFVCFGNKISDCFLHEANTNCRFIFEQFNSEESLIKTIKNILNE